MQSKRNSVVEEEQEYNTYDNKDDAPIEEEIESELQVTAKF
jgi:hypothetical protein